MPNVPTLRDYCGGRTPDPFDRRGYRIEYGDAVPAVFDPDADRDTDAFVETIDAYARHCANVAASRDRCALYAAR